MSDLNTKVTAESISALRKMRDELEDLIGQLQREVTTLQSVYEENRMGLGPHAEKIGALLEELGVSADEASVPVKKLQKKLTRAAMLRENILNESSYGRSR